jgi:formylglycine-generating enzyme required for sulfatase activity
MEWVTVGDPVNPCDPQPQPYDCYDSVDYVYAISKYEVTNAQYAEFLNAVAATDANALYNTEMDPTEYPHHGGITQSGSSGSYTYSVMGSRENWPVNYVSFYDIARFANWLRPPRGQY